VGHRLFTTDTTALKKRWQTTASTFAVTESFDGIADSAPIFVLTLIPLDKMRLLRNTVLGGDTSLSLAMLLSSWLGLGLVVLGQLELVYAPHRRHAVHHAPRSAPAANLQKQGYRRYQISPPARFCSPVGYSVDWLMGVHRVEHGYDSAELSVGPFCVTRPNPILTVIG